MSQRIYGPQSEWGILHMDGHMTPLPEFPALTHVQKAQCADSHRLPRHIHETFEIVYIASGRGQWRIEGTEYSLRPGDLLIIEPGEIHDGRADAQQPYTTYIAGFDPASLPVTRPQFSSESQNQELDQRLLQRKAEGVLVWDSPLRDLSQVADQVRVLNEALGGQKRRIWPGAYGIEPIFHRLLEELDRPIPSGDKEQPARILKVMMVQALLVEMLVFIARHQLELNELHQASRRVATPELHFWLQQRAGAPPSLREMAAKANLSAAHFAVTFKNETGLTPLEYMTNLRIKAAAKRLRTEPHISVTEIALDLGFSSPQYFSMVFQKVKGCSPTQWRSDTSTR